MDCVGEEIYVYWIAEFSMTELFKVVELRIKYLNYLPTTITDIH